MIKPSDRSRLSILKAVRAETDSVLVAFSRGKESLTVLDLAARHFPKVQPYYLYMVDGLSFIETYLEYIERRYSLSIIRAPHPSLTYAFRYGTYRAITVDCPSLSIRDTQDAMRKQTGIDWLLSGEKAADSLQRRGMMSSLKGINEKTHWAFPLAWWSHRHVWNYLKENKIPLPQEYAMFGHSNICTLQGENLYLIQKHWPEDFQKILKVFPFAEAAVKHYEWYGKKEEPPPVPRKVSDGKKAAKLHIKRRRRGRAPQAPQVADGQSQGHLSQADHPSPLEPKDH